MRMHRKVFAALMRNLVILTREARKWVARIVLEWPRNCSYWQEPIVQRYMYENQLKPVDVDGCSVGLRSIKNGLPIFKPWKFATNNAIIHKALQGFRCPRANNPGTGTSDAKARTLSGPSPIRTP